MAAAAVFHRLPPPSASCVAVSRKPKSLSLSPSVHLPAKPLGFSASVSAAASFPRAGFWLETSEKCRSLRLSVVCEAKSSKKPDSAAKRARQAEKRRLYNKAKKSEMRTRMKKALEALDVLKKKKDAQTGDILPIEKLIGEAYSAIDKAVKSGTLHRNTGANRKSRLARRKKAVEIHHGWYTPTAVAA